jgi:hypothetical protein
VITREILAVVILKIQKGVTTKVFGGMNYEQVRQPYGRNSGGRDKEDSEDDNRARRNDDL